MGLHGEYLCDYSFIIKQRLMKVEKEIGKKETTTQCRLPEEIGNPSIYFSL